MRPIEPIESTKSTQPNRSAATDFAVRTIDQPRAAFTERAHHRHTRDADAATDTQGNVACGAERDDVFIPSAEQARRHRAPGAAAAADKKGNASAAGGTSRSPARRYLRRLGVKSAICGGLLVCILLVRAIDAGFTQTLTAGVREALTYSVSLDEALGKLKFVEQPLNDIAQVFAPTVVYTAPVQGGIVETYNAASHPYVGLATVAGESVQAAAAGSVCAQGEDDELGTYLQVRHTNGSITGYYGVRSGLVLGEAVAAGQVLGVACGDRVYFALTGTNGEASDPVVALG